MSALDAVSPMFLTQIAVVDCTFVYKGRRYRLTDWDGADGVFSVEEVDE